MIFDDDDIIESDDIVPLSDDQSLFGQIDDEPSGETSEIVDLDPEQVAALEEEDYLATLEFGTTWAFDFEAGRFFKRGNSGQVAQVSEKEAFAQWCMAALHTERLTAYVVTDQFGVEFENIVRSIGGATVAAAMVRQTIEEALSVHDRYNGIDKFTATIDGDYMLVTFDIDTTEGPVEIETKVEIQ